MKTFGSLCGAVVVLASFPAVAQLVVYDNLAPAGSVPFYSGSSGGNEFGDEVTLVPSTPRTIDTFSIEYFSQNLSGNEVATVRLYRNDGGMDSQGFPKPNSLLYEVAGVGLDQLNGRGVFTLYPVNLTVPNTFTWTVQFGGVADGEIAGLVLTGPPSKGVSFDDYWERNGSDWNDLVPLEGVAVESSFGAQITAVPEPAATAGVFLAAALACVIGHRFYSRRAIC